MKTLLTLLGKGIIVLLYWALVALLVWLFYDEYLAEQEWSSICKCIAFLSLGFALHGMLINILYKKLLKQIEHNYKKMYNILVNVVYVVSIIFGGIFVVSLLVGIAGDFIYICIYGVIQIVKDFGEFWFLMILLFAMWIILKGFKSPLIKAMSKIIYRLFLLSFCALIIFIEVDVWKNLTDTDSFTSNSLIAGCVVLIFIFGFLCYLLYNSIERGILSFARFRYVLFLRAFKDDDVILSIYDKISKSINDVPFLKIGNPDKSESENVNEHWLPLSNWKFFLKFYISKAKAIVTVVSSTDGLIWEMIENMKYLNKCVVVFVSVDDLTEFKKKLLMLDKDVCDVMISSIEMVIKNWQYENAFVIQKYNIYLGEVCQLINCVLKNDFKNIRVVNVPCIDSAETKLIHKSSISGIGDFLFRHFHILSFVNSFESIHNHALRGVLNSFAFVVVAAFFLAQFLLGVGMLLYPLLIWFGDNIDWLSISYESDSVAKKMFMTWFYIAFGLGFVKDLFRKD